MHCSALHVECGFEKSQLHSASSVWSFSRHLVRTLLHVRHLTVTPPSIRSSKQFQETDCCVQTTDISGVSLDQTLVLEDISMHQAFLEIDVLTEETFYY